MLRLVPIATLTLLLVAHAGMASPPQVGDAAVTLEPVDALGRTVTTPVPGRLTLLSFAGPATGEAAGRIARALRVAHPELEILSFIDLSSYPRFTRGFVRREIVRRQERAVEETRAAFVEAGRPAPPDLAERVHVIPDFEAESFAHYGVTRANEAPVLVLVGANGLVRASFEDPALGAVEEAVAGALE